MMYLTFPELLDVAEREHAADAFSHLTIADVRDFVDVTDLIEWLRDNRTDFDISRKDAQ